MVSSKNRKIRRPRVNEGVRMAIASYPEKMSAGEVRAAFESVAKKNGWHVPSIRTIFSIRKKARLITIDAGFKKQEVPWQLGHLYNSTECSIQPEALSKILKIKARNDYQSMPVRVVKWVSRLSSLDLSLTWLWWWANEYSEAERLSSLVGDAFFDTTSIDNDLAALLGSPDICHLDGSKLASDYEEFTRDNNKMELYSLNVKLIDNNLVPFDLESTLIKKGSIRTYAEYLIKKELADR